MLTDPDGIDDLIGGTLMNAGECITCGAFATSGQEGAYQLTLSWIQINTAHVYDDDTCSSPGNLCTCCYCLFQYDKFYTCSCSV